MKSNRKVLSAGSELTFWSSYYFVCVCFTKRACSRRESHTFNAENVGCAKRHGSWIKIRFENDVQRTRCEINLPVAIKLSVTPHHRVCSFHGTLWFRVRNVHRNCCSSLPRIHFCVQVFNFEWHVFSRTVPGESHQELWAQSLGDSNSARHLSHP